MDLVLNHTSDKHPWFKESASSRTIEKPTGTCGGPEDGRRPSASRPTTGSPSSAIPRAMGSVRQQYYHRFYIQQPDLNLEQPEVRKAMYDVERF